MSHELHPGRPPLDAGRRDLAERYYPAALARAHRLAERHGWHDREELISAAGWGVVEAAARWDESGPARFGTYARAWVDGACREAMRAWRGRARLPKPAASPDPIDLDDLPGPACGLGAALMLDDLIAPLGPRQAETLRIVYGAGRSLVEAGRALGVSESAIWGRHRRALAGLRRRLESA